MILCLEVEFESKKKLDAGDREAVEALTQACMKNDGVNPAIYFDTHLNLVKDMDAWFLAWARGKAGNRVLAAAARIFVPTRHEAELAVAVNIPFRKQGLFRSLMVMARQTLCKAGIKRLLLAVDGRRGYGAVIANSLGSSRSHGEHKLVLKADEFSQMPQRASLRLVPVNSGNSDLAASLSQSIFAMELDDAKKFIVEAIKDKDREQFLAFSEAGAIGMVSCSLFDGAHIYGLGVLPEHRGRHYGLTIMDIMLELLFKRGYKTVTIEVDDKNTAAIALYRKKGFVEESKVDYWLILPGKDGKQSKYGGEECI